MSQETNDEAKVYEKKPFGEWYTEDEADEAMGIETCEYDNGSRSKRCKLKDGREAVSSMIKGNARVAISRIIGKDSSKINDAIVAVSTKIDNKPIVIEDLDALWYADLLKLQAMSGSINFM